MDLPKKQKKDKDVRLSLSQEDKELAEKVRIKTGYSWSDLFRINIRELHSKLFEK